jgi:hypothetical protein
MTKNKGEKEKNLNACPKHPIYACPKHPSIQDFKIKWKKLKLNRRSLSACPMDPYPLRPSVDTVAEGHGDSEVVASVEEVL